MLVGKIDDLPPSLTTLSTTGLLKEESPVAVERWIDASCGAGLVNASNDEYRTLSLTTFGRDVMTGRVTEVAMAMPRAPSSSPRRTRDRRRRGKTPVAPADVPPASEDAIGVLRAWRLDVARSRGIAPFIILHDRTLMAIAAMRPQSLDDLSAVPGIGPAKLAEYGEAIVGVLKGKS